MKITFVLSTLSLHGGIRSTAMLADRLQKRGHEVSAIAVPKRTPNLRNRVRSLLQGKGWFSHLLREPSHFDYIDVPVRLLESRRPITDADVPDADIVVATWWETAEWVAQLSPSKGAKVYFIRHHETHDYLPIDRVAATYSLPLHKITTAQWLVDLMRDEYNDSHVSVVPNSVDTNLFDAPPRGKQKIPTVGMMYSQEPWKGCDISLKAFSLAARNIPNLRLVAFGMQESVKNLPLPPGTQFVCQPPQSMLKEFYAQCDAWLFASRVEGFGLPILEAMACRTPVIGTPVGAAPELLADGTGILVKPENPEDMARAIEQICRLDEQEWKTMSDRAYRKASRYTWDDAAELCEQAFRVAISRQSTNLLASAQ